RTPAPPRPPLCPYTTLFRSPEQGIDRETAREVVEECRRNRTRLSDTLVSWGLVDRARLRDCMLAWTTRKLAAIRQFAAPRTLFLDRKSTRLNSSHVKISYAV